MCHVYAFINLLSIFERWNERINDLFRTNTNKMRSSNWNSRTKSAIKQCAQLGGVLSNQQHTILRWIERNTLQNKNEMTTWNLKAISKDVHLHFYCHSSQNYHRRILFFFPQFQAIIKKRNLSFIHIYHLVKCGVQFKELKGQIAGIYRQGFWCLKKRTSRWNYRQRHCWCQCVLNDDWIQHQNRVKKRSRRKSWRRRRKLRRNC